MKRIRRYAYYRGGLTSLTMIVPSFASILTFVVYRLVVGELKAEIVFPAMAYFNLLRMPLFIYPMVVAQLVDALVAANRILKYMLAPELTFRPTYDRNSDNGIEINDGTFLWEGKGESVEEEAKNEPESTASKSKLEDTSLPGVHDISLKIPKGALVGVVGSVGSGKSSLLSAMVGEMRCEKGSVTFGGNVGYCPQQAWIQNATVRQNILFGLPFDEKRYQQVLQDCALVSDMEILQQGDQTEIGEKGINLSGGQKQRVSLARAVYYEADIILLDDPLSAVDAHVGRHLFDKCIKGVLQKKTRVLVTHQLNFIPEVDYVVFMKDGCIHEQGKYQDLIAKGGEFSDLMKSFGGINTEITRRRSSAVSIAQLSDSAAKNASNIRNSISSMNNGAFAADQISELRQTIQSHHSLKESLVNLDAKETPRLMQEEERAVGAVKPEVYLGYLKAYGGLAFFVFIVLTLLCSQATGVGTDLWLSYWVSPPDLLRNQSQDFFMYIYAIWGASQGVTALFLAILFTIGGSRAASKLHNRAFSRIIRAPVSFYDTTPLGRMINR